MRRFDVLAIGEVLVDLVAPDAPNLAGAESFLRTAGGAPANVASAVARLGGRAAFVGAVGDDPFGAYLQGVLREHGVDLSGLRLVTERTSLAFVASNQGGIPEFVFYRGADAALRPDDLRPHQLAASSFIYLTSLALLADPARETTLAAVSMARREGGLVAVDPNLRPSSWPSIAAARSALEPLTEGADLLKVNETEARLLSGFDELTEAAAALAGERRLVVITRGEQGCLWHWHGASACVPAPRVEVADTTGAGDAFLGALLAELARRGYTAQSFHRLSLGDLVSSLRFACAAGSLSCLQPGAMASLPSRAEVEAALARHGEALVRDTVHPLDGPDL